MATVPSLLRLGNSPELLEAMSVLRASFFAANKPGDDKQNTRLIWAQNILEENFCRALFEAESRLPITDNLQDELSASSHHPLSPRDQKTNRLRGCQKR